MKSYVKASQEGWSVKTLTSQGFSKHK